MAFATPEARSTGENASATAHVIALPDGSDVVGKLLVIEFAVTTLPSVTAPSGWDTVAAGDLANNGGRYRVFARIVDGSEGFTGTDDTVEVATNNARDSTYIVRRWGDHDGWVAAGSVASGNSQAPDPPAITLDASPADYTVVAACAAATPSSGVFITDFPASYEDEFQHWPGFGLRLANCSREVTATSEDPGEFAIGGAIGRNWAAATYAIAGAGAAGVDVDVPLAQTATEAYAPAVAAGVSIAVPVALTETVAYAPTLAQGAAVDVPTALTATEAYAPTVAAGVSIAVPTAQTATEAYAPTVAAGASVGVPTALTATLAYAPVVAAGVSVQVPTALTATEAYAPFVGGVTLIAVPLAETATEAYAPTVAAGVGIRPPVALTATEAYAPTVSAGVSIVVPFALTTQLVPALLLGTDIRTALRLDAATERPLHLDTRLIPEE